MVCIIVNGDSLPYEADLVNHLIQFLTHIGCDSLFPAIGKETALGLLQTTMIPHLDSLPFTVFLVIDGRRPFVMRQSLGIKACLELMTLKQTNPLSY